MIDIEELIQKVKNEKAPFTKARLIRKIRAEFDIDSKDLAKKIGLSPSNISHYLRILKLPELVVDGYIGELVSLTHLFIISRLHSDEDMINAYETVLTKNLNSQETEKLIRQVLFGLNSNGVGLSEELKSKIEEKFKKIDPAINVELIQTRIRARVQLTINGNKEKTSRILEKIFQ